MSPRVMAYGVAALIAASVVYELATGVARVRGAGEYRRAERPGSYWATLGAKAALAVVTGWLGAYVLHG